MSAPAAVAERPAAGAPQAPAPVSPAPVRRHPLLTRRGAVTAFALVLSGLLCFVTFEAGGGLHLQSMTVVELVLTLGGALAVAAALLAGRVATDRGPMVDGPMVDGNADRDRPRAHGAWTVGLMLALTALTALSVGWSVAPDSSWQDAGRMLAYSAVLAAAVALVRLAPRAWPALLGGIVLSATIVCGYALLTKVLPAQLDPNEVYARLQEPYGYWNAIGLTAVLGALGCLWLGSRRSGHALLSAAAYPAMGLLLVTLLLAYSRGAIVALLVGVALWMAIVPLRLRSARLLIASGLGAAPVVGWAFTKHALSHDGISLAARTSAGHQLGVLLVAMLVVLTLAGVAIGFGSARHPALPATRRRIGALLVALLVLAVAVLGGGLAASKRGLTGTISHDFRSLTDPNAPVPANTPGRLTAIGSVRARYWKEALEVFGAHPALGAGASGYEFARLRYRKESLDVKHAHGYLVQTLSDLGLVGLALTLALLVAWLMSAARATLPLDRRLSVQSAPESVLGMRIAVPRSVSWPRAHAPYTSERIGLLAMLCIVVAFGVHSFADWTWYVPGNACVALLCAGWLAGRGPLRARPSADESELEDTLVLRSSGPRVGPLWSGVRKPALRLGALRADGRALALAACVLALGLLAAWTESQPQRSNVESEEALTLVARSPSAALAKAHSAVSRDPLSTTALFRLAAIQHAVGQTALGRATLQKAVRLQPSNPWTWLELGRYDLSNNEPRAAVQELRAAIYLNPELVAPEAIAKDYREAVATQNAFVEALRAATAAASRAAPASRTDGTHARAQKRARAALAKSTRRAHGSPPAPRTSTRSKPKSASKAASVRRV